MFLAETDLFCIAGQPRPGIGSTIDHGSAARRPVRHPCLQFIHPSAEEPQVSARAPHMAAARSRGKPPTMNWAIFYQYPGTLGPSRRAGKMKWTNYIDWTQRRSQEKTYIFIIILSDVLKWGGYL